MLANLIVYLILIGESCLFLAAFLFGVVKDIHWLQYFIAFWSVLSLAATPFIWQNRVSMYKNALKIPRLRDFQFYCEAVALGGLLVYGWYFSAFCYGVYVAIRAKIWYF